MMGCGQQARNGLGQAQADDAADGVMRRGRKAAGREGCLHRGADLGLTIDQRAVAIEHR